MYEEFRCLSNWVGVDGDCAGSWRAVSLDVDGRREEVGESGRGGWSKIGFYNCLLGVKNG